MADPKQATTWAALMAIGAVGPAPIGIVGIGGLGTLAVQFAKALGLQVVAIDNRPEGRELATAFDLKADLVLDPEAKDSVLKIKEWSGRDGLAAVVVCTDHIGISKWSLTTLRPHGVAVPLGLPPDGFTFDAFDLIFNEITIKGSLVANRVQTEDMLRIVARHNIKSHLKVLTMKDGPQLPEMYMDRHLQGRIVMKIA
jgi:D-arabinose 1-dehydrogenase-like Zn-dependent alcohol dehydrogenase